MMSQAIRVWCGVLAAAMTMAARADPVSVAVTAQHGDGTPFPDLWLVLIPDDLNTPEIVTKSNEDGLVQFVIEPPVNAQHLFVKVAGLGSAPLAPINDRRAVRLQDTQIIPNYSFQTYLTIPLEEEVTEYSTMITMYQSVRVSVQLVDDVGQPVTGGVLMQVSGFGMDTDQNNYDQSDPLSIGGIRKGGSADVMIMGPASPKWKVIHLEPHQTMHDVDLSPIHIPPYQPGTVPLRLTVTGYSQLTTRAVEGLRGGVTVFSADGHTAIIFSTDHTTGLVVDRPPQQEARTPMLDPGVYFIAPGGLGTSPANTLRRLLLDGVDVEASGVPKITAVEGEEITLTIDAAVVEQAILAAAGK